MPAASICTERSLPATGQVWPQLVGAGYPCGRHPPNSEEARVSRIKGIVSTALVMKGIQVAQRELSKPENQRKIKDGVNKLRTKVTKPKS